MEATLIVDIGRPHKVSGRVSERELRILQRSKDANKKQWSARWQYVYRGEEFAGSGREPSLRISIEFQRS
jgi:hypothetical protein